VSAAVTATGGALRRLVTSILAAVEPWYDFGRACIDSVQHDVSGDGRFFSIDWLGLHLTVFYGRTPKQEG